MISTRCQKCNHTLQNDIVAPASHASRLVFDALCLLIQSTAYGNGQNNSPCQCRVVSSITIPSSHSRIVVKTFSNFVVAETNCVPFEPYPAKNRPLCHCRWNVGLLSIFPLFRDVNVAVIG